MILHFYQEVVPGPGTGVRYLSRQATPEEVRWIRETYGKDVGKVMLYFDIAGDSITTYSGKTSRWAILFSDLK